MFMKQFGTSYKEVREEIFGREGRKYPGKALVEMELRPGYNAAKTKKIQPMLAVNEAHLLMLIEQGIVPASDGKKIMEQLETVDYDKYAQKAYTGEFEDLFFEIENELIQRTNGLAGNIHLARSRNDMSLCLDHMVVRSELLSLIELLLDVQNTIKVFAFAHKDTLYVAHTHTQHAQPSVLGHYFLGVFDVLCRDIDRLAHAYHHANSSPMGAAAITTSGFPISRQRVSELLGFETVIENSYDAIGNADFFTETAAAIGLAALNLGRVITDLVVWATEELHMIRVADGYISTSSIMPQKRNPIALEHLRASLSVVKGLSDTVLDGYLKSPYGDISDHEDVEPILSQAFELLEKNYDLFNSVIGTLEVDVDLLARRAHESFSVVTEVADELVRLCGLPFRQAHHVVATLVREAEKNGYDLKKIDSGFFSEIYRQVTGTPFVADFNAIQSSLDPVMFVLSRNVYGGIGPAAMDAMFVSAAEKQKYWRNWLSLAYAGLENADTLRNDLIQKMLR